MMVEWTFAGNQTLGSYELPEGLMMHALICENRMLALPYSAVMFRRDRRRIRSLGDFAELSSAIQACEVGLKRTAEALEEVA